MQQLDRVGKGNQTQLRCGFWEADAQVWSTDGCSITSDNQTGVVCTCNHLTDFAVLVVSVVIMVKMHCIVGTIKFENEGNYMTKRALGSQDKMQNYRIVDKTTVSAG